MFLRRLYGILRGSSESISSTLPLTDKVKTVTHGGTSSVERTQYDSFGRTELRARLTPCQGDLGTTQLSVTFQRRMKIRPWISCIALQIRNHCSPTLRAPCVSPPPFSFIIDPQAQLGTLDYILASSTALGQRSGDVLHYHINADEADVLG